MCRFFFSILSALTLFVWSTPTTTQDIDLFQPREVSQIGSGILTSIDWRPDGNQIAIGSNQSIWLFSAQLQLRESLDIDNARVLRWNPDGSLIAIGRSDGFIELRSTIDWSITEQFQVSSSPIQEIKWDSTGNKFAVIAIGETSVTIWDVNGDQQYEFSHSHQGPIQSFDWSPSDQRIAIAYFEGNIHIWDVINREHILEFTQHPAFVADIAWQPGGELIASSGVASGSSGTPENTAILIWSAENGEVTHRLRSEQVASTSPITWSNDGQRLAGTTQSGSQTRMNEFSTSIRIWNVSNGDLENEWVVSEDNQITQLAWQPDGDALAYRKALRRQNQMITVCGDELIGLINTNDGSNLVFRNDGHNAEIDSIVWNEDNRHIATGSADKTIRIWNVSTGRQTQILEGHECRVQSLVWHPVTNQLASYGTDDTIRVWNVSNEEILFQTDFSVWFMTPAMQTLAWDSSGNYLAAANHAGEVTVWDIRDGTVRYDAQVASSNLSFAALNWVSDKLTFAFAELPTNEIKIWQITDEPIEISSFVSAGDIAYRGVWNAAGNSLALYSGEGTVQIWDMTRESIISTIVTTSNVIPDLTWVSDDRILVNDTLYTVAGSPIVTLVVPGNNLAISPKGDLLTSIVSGNVIKVWAIDELQ